MPGSTDKRDMIFVGGVLLIASPAISLLTLRDAMAGAPVWQYVVKALAVVAIVFLAAAMFRQSTLRPSLKQTAEHAQVVGRKLPLMVVLPIAVLGYLIVFHSGEELRSYLGAAWGASLWLLAISAIIGFEFGKPQNENSP